MAPDAEKTKHAAVTARGPEPLFPAVPGGLRRAGVGGFGLVFDGETGKVDAAALWVYFLILVRRAVKVVVVGAVGDGPC